MQDIKMEDQMGQHESAEPENETSGSFYAQIHMSKENARQLLTIKANNSYASA